jgi:hypothetical protein
MKGKGSKKPSVRSFSSKGSTHRKMSRITGRMHNLLSNHEENYFLILEYADDIFDFEDQYMLPTNFTTKIAKKLKIRHPFNIEKNEPYPLSTDFLIKKKGGEVLARTIKPFDKLNKSTIKKFEIERFFWEMQGVNWGIVTEHEIPPILVKNLRLFEDHKKLRFEHQFKLRALAAFTYNWNPELTIKGLATLAAKSLEIPLKDMIQLILNLLYLKKLLFKHDQFFNLEMKVSNYFGNEPSTKQFML